MKINSKKGIVFIFSLSVLQVVIVSPAAFAAIGRDVNTGELRYYPDATDVKTNPNTLNDKERALQAARNASSTSAGTATSQSATGIHSVTDTANPSTLNDKEKALQAANQGGAKSVTDTRPAPSCDNIVAQGKTQLQEFATQMPDFQQAFGDPQSTFGTGRETSDAALNDLRGKQDENRNAMYMKLEDLATTDAQKAAVEAFKKTVEGSVTDHQGATDAAIAKFRQDVDALMLAQKAAVNKAVETFQASVQAAFQKAQASCANKGNPETVRATLTTSIQEARAKLEVQQQSITAASETVSTLAATRNVAVERELKNFTATMEKARTDLKAAFQTTDRPTY